MYVLLFQHFPRASCSASYNPTLPVNEVDENIKTTKQMAASRRSQAQAFYMVITWSNEAVKGKKRRKQ